MHMVTSRYLRAALHATCDFTCEQGAVQAISEFLLQAICTHNGELRALLVLGHADNLVFPADLMWSRLHELLDVLLFSAVKDSSLSRYVAFAELLQVMTCGADTVTFLSHWLPPLLVGTHRLRLTCFVV